MMMTPLNVIEIWWAFVL